VQRLTYLAAANERKAAHFELQQAIALGVLKAIGFCNGAFSVRFWTFGVVTPDCDHSGRHGPELLLSELFGVVSALRRNASQTEAATNMAAIHKQNQIFTPIVGATLGSREGTLVLPRRLSGLSGTPNSSQTLRHIAIKATDRRSTSNQSSSCNLRQPSPST
jgi:hypothetical protein